jgi:hypothetical protein
MLAAYFPASVPAPVSDLKLPRGAAISMHANTYNRGAPPFSNIIITGNTFLRSGAPAIKLIGFNNGLIASNRFEKSSAPPIDLNRCSNIRIEENN